jgi:hypothetical protein
MTGTGKMHPQISPMDTDQRPMRPSRIRESAPPHPGARPEIGSVRAGFARPATVPRLPDLLSKLGSIARERAGSTGRAIAASSPTPRPARLGSIAPGPARRSHERRHKTKKGRGLRLSVRVHDWVRSRGIPPRMVPTPAAPAPRERIGFDRAAFRARPAPGGRSGPASAPDAAGADWVRSRVFRRIALPSNGRATPRAEGSDWVRSRVSPVVSIRRIDKEPAVAARPPSWGG